MVQKHATDFLRLGFGFTATAWQYQASLRTVPEPYARELRLDYLEYLQLMLTSTDGEQAKKDFEAARDGQAALLRADALLVEKEYQQATALYRTQLQQAGATLPARLDAWSGLLDSDPATALPAPRCSTRCCASRSRRALSSFPGSAGSSGARWGTNSRRPKTARHGGWPIARCAMSRTGKMPSLQ